MSLSPPKTVVVQVIFKWLKTNEVSVFLMGSELLGGFARG